MYAENLLNVCRPHHTRKDICTIKVVDNSAYQVEYSIFSWHPSSMQCKSYPSYHTPSPNGWSKCTQTHKHTL